MFGNIYEAMLALEGLADLDASEVDGDTLFLSTDSDGETIEVVSLENISEEDEITAIRIA